MRQAIIDHFKKHYDINDISRSIQQIDWAEKLVNDILIDHGNKCPQCKGQNIEPSVIISGYFCKDCRTHFKNTKVL